MDRSWPLYLPLISGPWQQCCERLSILRRNRKLAAGGGQPLPSGKQTVCYWKLPFIVDFPIKHGDFP